MKSGWIELTAQRDGERVWVDLSSSSTIEEYGNGSRIRFSSKLEIDTFDAVETPDEIITLLALAERK
jgi:hypothetical protein